MRYLEDGRSYLCDPSAFARRCDEERVECNLDVILLGPQSVYEACVRIEPPTGFWNPNSFSDAATASTAAAFLRGFRSYGLTRARGQREIFIAAATNYV